MNKIRDTLNEIYWKKEYDFNKVEVWYIHRGAPNNTKIVYGNNILSIEKTFIKTTETMIPHHRIFKIIYDETVLFDRETDT